MSKKNVFISLSLAALLVLASFLIFTPTIEKYSTSVTVKVIKVEMLEKVKLDGKLAQGAFTVALNDSVKVLQQQSEL